VVLLLGLKTCACFVLAAVDQHVHGYISRFGLIFYVYEVSI